MWIGESMARTSKKNKAEVAILLEVAETRLEGDLSVPDGARSIIVFVHGSGGGRADPLDRRVAEELRHHGLATLLIDLISQQEKGETLLEELETRFDIPMLARRVTAATDWLRHEASTRELTLGFFGSGTGTAAAIVAAATMGDVAGAIVSADGRPDLAGDALGRIHTPTLLIVGEGEPQLHFLNRQAYEALAVHEKGLEVIPGGTHMLERPGDRDEVARRAAEWFQRHL